MNYLQLAQRLRRRCRVIGSGPTAVTGQNEEYSRLLDWINEAWMDIQLAREDWQWMRTTASCVTVTGQAVYSPTADFNLTDFGNWDQETFRNYVTAVGQASEIRTQFIGYEDWRNKYQFGATRYAPSRPNEITITPDKSVGTGPVAIAGYTITGDYFRVPSELVAAEDTPALPERFHMAIVYRAMMFYGASEAAQERYDEGKAEFEKMMRRMLQNQLPEVQFGSALA